MDEPITNCPFCLGIPTVGPNPVVLPKTRFDRVLYETPRIVLTPALGMIVPGSFLIVSKTHVHSYAAFEEQTLPALDRDVKEIIEWLTVIFGEYLLFEHGASSIRSDPHGGCIIHAHFHLFPTAEATGPIVLNALPWLRLKTLSDLSSAGVNSYALVRLAGQYYLSISPKLPSQWIRRVVVESLAISRHWDWGADFGKRELEETLVKLGVN